MARHSHEGAQMARIVVRKRTKVLLTLPLLFPLSLHAAGTFFLATFEDYATSKSQFRDTGSWSQVLDTFGFAARVWNPDSTKIINIEHKLPAESIRGAKLKLSGWTRASNISHPPLVWNGVKVQITMFDSSGNATSSMIPMPNASTWSWARKEFIVSVPPNLQEAKLTFGLERVSGTAWFDSIQIEVLKQDLVPARDSITEVPRSSSVRLRGMTTWNWAEQVDTSAINRFGNNWKGNLLRWHLNPPGFRDSGLLSSKFDTYLEAELKKLDAALPLCRRNGIQLAVLLQNLSEGLFHDAAAQERLIRTWAKIASRYRDESVIWGWDIVNEPREDDWKPGLMFWDELADTIARTIRKVDTSKAIIVETTNAANVAALTDLKPVGWKRGFDIRNVVYSFHFYEPGYLTHQGMIPGYEIGPSYPGMVGKDWWDKDKIRQTLAPAFEFQKRYRVPIYVGEFSCVRWAPGQSAYNWLSDVLSILEETDWNWTYHSYNEYQAWNLELPQERLDSTSLGVTDRLELLLDYLALNQKPPQQPPPSKTPTSSSFTVRLSGSGLEVDDPAGQARPILIGLYGSKFPVAFSRTATGWMLRHPPKGAWFLSFNGEITRIALP